MEKKSSTTTRILLIILLAVVATGDDSIAKKCESSPQHLIQFLTAMESVPSHDCCSSVGGLKQTTPVCLCFIIEQAVNDSNGVILPQLSQLLQLPSLCNLVDPSLTHCPKLLHLPRNSTDAAVYFPRNTTSVVDPTTSDASSVPNKPRLATSILVTVLIFFQPFPTAPF